MHTAILMSGLSSCGGDDCSGRPPITPCEPGKQATLTVTNRIYFDALRTAVSWGAQQKIKHNGKIIIYNNLLLIIEPDEGVHVFNNENPENPINLGFINIPGNKDITVNNHTIYADSYTDLVMLKIKEEGGIEEMGRLNNVFIQRYLTDNEGVILAQESTCQ